MPTILSGSVDTNTILAAERVVDMDEEIKMVDVDLSQFSTMLMKLGANDATRERVDWLEDDYFPRLVTVGTSATSAATQIGFSTGESAVVRVNDLIRNQVTGECYKVTGITSDSAIGIARPIGGVAAASAQTGQQCLIIGNAFLQGANIGAHKVVQRTNNYNYTQIYRHSWSFTRTQTKIKLYGGREPNKERAKKLVEHKRAIEYGLFWGARSIDTTGAHPVGTMGGAFEYISTYVKNEASSTLTAAEFDKHLIDGLQHGSTNKVFFCSPIVAYNISQFPASAYRTNVTGEQRYGIKIDAYVSGAYGFEVPVVVKRDWNDFIGTTGTTAGGGFGGVGFLIDMEEVQLRPLTESNTKLYSNRQGNDEDSLTEEYLTEVTLEFPVEKRHLYLKGVTSV